MTKHQNMLFLKNLVLILGHLAAQKVPHRTQQPQDKIIKEMFL